MIEKLLHLRDSSSSTFRFNPNTSSKALPLANLQSKTTNKWNQLDFSYFHPILNMKAHGEGKIILVEKNVYYRNVILLVQHIQNLITFIDFILVEKNISTSLKEFVFKWYTSKLVEYNQNILNNNLSMKSWINILFYCFKVPTSMALDLLTYKTYLLDNALCR